MSSELKPCPFCGGEPKVMKTWRYPGRSNGVEGYTIICENMDCIMYMESDWYKRTKKRAIEAWNTRAERTCKNRGSYMGCSECGWYINENDRYCGGCGAKVVEL